MLPDIICEISSNGVQETNLLFPVRLDSIVILVGHKILGSAKSKFLTESMGRPYQRFLRELYQFHGAGKKF